MKFHSWGLRVNSSSDSITISKMILLLDEFLAISAVTKYFSWGEGRRPSPPVYSQFTTPRWKRWHEFTVQFSILFLLPLLPFHSLLIFRSHPFVTLHYLLLRNVEDSFSLRCAGKISGAKSRFAISSIHKRNESTNFLRSMAEYGGREYDEYPIDRLGNNPRN